MQNVISHLAIIFRKMIMSNVAEKDIEKFFQWIRENIKNSGFEDIRRILDIYVDKITVYPQYVTVAFNYLPTLIVARNYQDERKNDKKESISASQTNVLTFIEDLHKTDHFGGESRKISMLNQDVRYTMSPQSITA